MSHNTPKIGTATQDRVGALGPTVEDLDDVTGAPSLNDVLKWTGTNWIPGAPPSPTQGIEMVAWAGGYFSGYSIGSNKQPSVGSFYFMSLAIPAYRCLFYHDLTSATWIDTTGITAFTTGSLWLNRVELEPGTYLLKAQHLVAGSDYVDVQWQTEAGASLGPIRRISAITNPCNVPGRIIVTSTIRCGLMIIAKSGSSIAAPTDTDNQYLQSTIVRIA